jgi:hypothetical protein
MPRKPRPEPDDPEQSRLFVETARDLEVDETGNSFNQVFAVIMPIQPKQPTPNGENHGHNPTREAE